MSAWAWLVANPRVAARVVGYGTLALCIGLLILRAERAERLRAEYEAARIAAEFDRDGIAQKLEAAEDALRQWQAAAAKESERRIVAERKARTVRIRTIESVRVVRETVVPADCTAAIEYAATEAPKIAAWGNRL